MRKRNRICFLLVNYFYNKCDLASPCQGLLPEDPQSVQPWWLCCPGSVVTLLHLPSPFQMSSVTQQRSHRSAIRDEGGKKPQKCFPFLKNFPFISLIPLPGNPGSHRPVVSCDPQSGFFRTHPSSSWLLPRPGNSNWPSFSEVSDSVLTGAHHLSP